MEEKRSEAAEGVAEEADAPVGCGESDVAPNSDMISLTPEDAGAAACGAAGAGVESPLPKMSASRSCVVCCWAAGIAPAVVGLAASSPIKSSKASLSRRNEPTGRFSLTARDGCQLDTSRGTGD